VEILGWPLRIETWKTHPEKGEKNGTLAESYREEDSGNRPHTSKAPLNTVLPKGKRGSHSQRKKEKIEKRQRGGKKVFDREKST